MNVGGKGMPMERLAMLAQIAQKQEAIMLQGGLSNPLAGIPEYRNTLARMLETVSISDVSSYFKPLPPGWQAPPPPNKPAAEELLAQVEAQKTAANVENDRAKQQTDRAKMITEDDRERDRAALDAWTKAWAVSAQHGTPMPSLDEFKAGSRERRPGDWYAG